MNCGGRTGILLKKIMNRAWDGLGEALEGSLTIRFMVREFFHLARVKLSEIFIKSVSKDVMNGDVMYPTSTQGVHSRGGCRTTQKCMQSLSVMCLGSFSFVWE
ncbi:hypothetical protein MKW98_019358 [Papaver atlanticum]|uniref:Uncharacterized protein n=1 Tax=Papaver atlanticum TaxID=357466 RepID=A0AAD4S9W4_9MAGN|nr:hypothetical protein MKW98_019358 [Papaver atlanticum]